MAVETLDPAATATPGPPREEHPVARRWWVPVLGAVVGVLLTLGVTLAIPAPYVASVTLVVDLPDSDVDTEALITTVQGLTTSGTVLGQLADATGAGLTAAGVRKRLRLERQIGAGVISVAVTDHSPVLARAIAERLTPILEQQLQRSRDLADPSTQLLGVHTFTEPTLQRQERPLLANAVLGGTAGFNLALIGTAVWVKRRARRG